MSKKNRKPNRQAKIDREKELRKARRFLRAGDDPILREVCVEVADDQAQRDQIAARMLKVIQAFNGIGISANQVGIAKRAMIMWPARRTGDEPWIAFNPKLLEHNDAILIETEGCLSHPGKRVSVDRWSAIRAEWTTLTGEKYVADLAGFQARVFLHELDHLDGRCRVADDNPAEPILPPKTVRKPIPKNPIIATAALAALAMAVDGGVLGVIDDGGQNSSGLPEVIREPGAAVTDEVAIPGGVGHEVLRDAASSLVEAKQVLTIRRIDGRELRGGRIQNGIQQIEFRDDRNQLVA